MRWSLLNAGPIHQAYNGSALSPGIGAADAYSPPQADSSVHRTCFRQSPWPKAMGLLVSWHDAIVLIVQALKGEGEMAEALYRNVYGMEDGKRKQAEALARYVQRELACLAMTDTEAVMSGKLKFSTDFLGSE